MPASADTWRSSPRNTGYHYLMQISIVTVNWNGLEVLPEYLDSLSAQTTSPHEVVVVDNGSTDGSEQLPDLAGAKVVFLPENRGFAEPCNIVVSHTTGDAVLLLNNDTSFGPDLIEVLTSALIEQPGIDLFSCSMRRWDQPDIMENAGIGYRRTLSGYQIGRGDPASRWNEMTEVFGPSGGAALIRRRVIDDIGLFDPAFWAYNEDVDFALRARLAGYGCLYLPTAVVRHREGYTARRLGRRKIFLNQRNAEWAMLRNVPRRVRRRYGWLHAAYIAQQVLRNGLLGPMVLRARLHARNNPLPRVGPRRISEQEFFALLG
jgi:GT2 family glycosyltransferase